MRSSEEKPNSGYLPAPGRFIGQVAVALSPVTGIEPGVVQVEGEEWGAISRSGRIETGAEARIIGVDGVRLVVEAVRGSN